MTRHRLRGQVFPIVVLFLFVFVFFIGANAARSVSGIRKIENQREADAFVMGVVNEQVRALNAIAALNEGLRIALTRGYAVGVALLTLKACTLLLFPSPYCAPALARLGVKAVPFFQNLSKLGEELAKEQDQIARWAAERPPEIAGLFNLVRVGKEQIFLFPERTETSGDVRSTRLPIRRRGAEDFGGMGANTEEIGLASGGDLKKCDRFLFDTYQSFHNARRSGRLGLGRRDSLTVEYADPETGFRKAVRPRTTLEIAGIGPNRSSYEFQNAVLLKCQSLHDLLSGFGFDGIVKIPSPYMLESRFFEGENRIGLARVTKGRKVDLDPLLKRTAGEEEKRPEFWALSEAEIDGGDLSKMDFRAVLSALHLDSEVWNVVEAEIPRLLVQGFEFPPRREDFHASLAH